MKKMKLHPVRRVIDKLRAINASPRQICCGFAFGVFMSTTPLVGLKWLVALPVVFIMKWSKMACMIGILQVNYLTGPFFYGLAYVVGKRVCGNGQPFEMLDRMSIGALSNIFFGNVDVFISLLIGGLILGIPLTIGAFYLVRSIVSSNFITETA